MDPKANSAAFSDHEYSQLSEDQLHSAIRFVEKRIRWVEEDHITLLRAYRDEVAVMRRHLFDRFFSRMVACSAPLSPQQHHHLSYVLEHRGISADETAIMIRAATKGRSDQLDALTEIEAMAILLRLECDP